MKKLTYFIIAVLLAIPLLSACADRDSYYQAVKEQNITMQLRMEQEQLAKEDRQNRHEIKMTKLITDMSVATGKTDNPQDDLMASMLVIMTNDKNQMAEMVYALNEDNFTLQTIEAPETAGEFVQKSASTVLGIGALTLGIVQSNNTADIAKTGLEASGVNVSGNGQYNNASNGSAIVKDTTVTSESGLNLNPSNSTSANKTNTSTTTNTSY